MEIRIKWTVIGILFFKISVSACYYPEYFVEEACLSGNETLIYDSTKVGSAGILKATSHPPYRPKKDCTIVIVPQKNQGILLSVQRIDFRQKGFFCQDYIKIFHSDVYTSPTIMCRFRFDTEGKISYYSRGPMRIVYHAEPEDYQGFKFEEGFSLTYTVVSEENGNCIADGAFLCDNGRCISNDRTCDGQNNCGDGSDEAPLLCDTVDLTVFQMVDVTYVMVFCVLIFSIIITCAVVFSRRRPSLDDTDSISDQDEPTARLTPYQAVHPTGFAICQNPAGPDSLYPCPSKTIHLEGGFSNPCYPSGIPQQPPPYCQ